MRISIFFLFVISGHSLIAQNEAIYEVVVKGTVVDTSGIRLKDVIVVLENKDGLLIDYTTSSDEGEFTIQLPSKYIKDSLNLKCQYLDLETSIYELNGVSSKIFDFGVLMMKPLSLNLSEIEITGKRKYFKTRGDTLIFNTEGTILKEDSSLEELVKQFPALRLTSDGSIFYKNKRIQDIKIDGKSLFKGEIKPALDIIPAKIVKALEVFPGSDSNPNQQALNLVLKEEFLNIVFGNLKGGFALDDRYDLTSNLNNFTSKNLFSVIGSINNINKPLFTKKQFLEIFLPSITSSSSTVLIPEEMTAFFIQDERYRGDIDNGYFSLDGNVEVRENKSVLVNYKYTPIISRDFSELVSNSGINSERLDKELSDASNIHRFGIRIPILKSKVKLDLEGKVSLYNTNFSSSQTLSSSTMTKILNYNDTVVTNNKVAFFAPEFSFDNDKNFSLELYPTFSFSNTLEPALYQINEEVEDGSILKNISTKLNGRLVEKNISNKLRIELTKRSKDTQLLFDLNQRYLKDNYVNTFESTDPNQNIGRYLFNSYGHLITNRLILKHSLTTRVGLEVGLNNEYLSKSISNSHGEEEFRNITITYTTPFLKIKYETAKKWNYSFRYFGSTRMPISRELFSFRIPIGPQSLVEGNFLLRPSTAQYTYPQS